MAVDTRNRRASALGCALRFRVLFPAPDGTIGNGDKIQLLGLYAGVPIGQAEPPPASDASQTPFGRLIEVAAPFGRLIE